jgi:hypothetical protein
MLPAEKTRQSPSACTASRKRRGKIRRHSMTVSTSSATANTPTFSEGPASADGLRRKLAAREHMVPEKDRIDHVDERIVDLEVGKVLHAAGENA